METEVVELAGHIIDSLLLGKVLDAIVDSGADYRITEIEVGRTNTDQSHARLEISAPDARTLERLLENLNVYGVNRTLISPAHLVACECDGVLPAGFYSTTNLPTYVVTSHGKLKVENPEMDCALVVSGEAVRTVPMHRVRAGDLVVVGLDGVEVTAPSKPRGPGPFEFMSSEVSSERPKSLLLERVAGRLRAARTAGGKVLVVAGPAVIHTGCRSRPCPARAPRLGGRLVRGQRLCHSRHRVQRSRHLARRIGEGGHARQSTGTPTTFERSTRYGEPAPSRRQSKVAGFLVASCTSAYVPSVPFLLAGSLRDDGPLPDVITDTVQAADVMRELIDGVTVALMLASTLHAIATGNVLPCVGGDLLRGHQSGRRDQAH